MFDTRHDFFTTLAQVTAGASAGGLGAMLANPAMGPLYGALAALLVALVQALLKRVQGKRGLDEDTENAIHSAALAAARAAVEIAREGLEKNRAAGPVVPKLHGPGPGATLLALFACLALGTSAEGCASTPRQIAVVSTNVIADTANALGPQLLGAYCRDSLHALGREGEYTAGRCVSTNSEPFTPAPAQAAALADVRARYAPIWQAWALAVALQNEIATLLEAGATPPPELLTRAAEAMANVQVSAARLGGTR